MHDLEYIRRRQKLLEKRRKRAAEVEAKEEALNFEYAEKRQTNYLQDWDEE